MTTPVRIYDDHSVLYALKDCNNCKYSDTDPHNDPCSPCFGTGRRYWEPQITLFSGVKKNCT